MQFAAGDEVLSRCFDSFALDNMKPSKHSRLNQADAIRPVIYPRFVIVF